MHDFELLTSDRYRRPERCAEDKLGLPAGADAALSFRWLAPPSTRIHHWLANSRY